MSRLKKILITLVVLLVVLQLVPIALENPPVTGEITAPPAVLAILQRSCYDCHSNEVRWPWYSHIAPVSFLVADDVNEAREHLNFSEWSGLSADDRAEAVEEIWEEVASEEMPLWFYLPLHPSAKLSAEDLATLKAWAMANGAKDETDEVGE